MSTSTQTRVLVVENSGTNRSLMVYLLEAFGYATLEAADGAIGVQMALDQRPDLVVCDLHLPKLDGFGVVKALKSNNDLDKIPIIGERIGAGTGKLVAAYFQVRGPVSDPWILPKPITSVAEFVKKTLGMPINIIRPNTIK